MRSSERFNGCIFGGAVGDALGYAVEFYDLGEIKAKYGDEGIRDMELYRGQALISDDTQMSLFTAAGLLYGTAWMRRNGEKRPYEYFINSSYKDWYRTQTENYPLYEGEIHSWLCTVAELFADRAAGMACMASMRKGGGGSPDNPLNDSKGCGGIMRVSPIGLYFLDRNISAEMVDMIGAGAAALTHGHEMGYIPAAAMVHMIQLLASDEEPSMKYALEDMKDTMRRLFPDSEELDGFIRKIELAEELAESDLPDIEAITQIGEGWVADETFAIAVYCSLKYENDFEKAVTAAVNHRGDSDSTGAVTGNLMGAIVGISGIPERFTENLELKDVIQEIADDLYMDFRDPDGITGRSTDEWMSRYLMGE